MGSVVIASLPIAINFTEQQACFNQKSKIKHLLFMLKWDVLFVYKPHHFNAMLHLLRLLLSLEVKWYCTEAKRFLAATDGAKCPS